MAALATVPQFPHPQTRQHPRCHLARQGRLIQFRADHLQARSLRVLPGCPIHLLRCSAHSAFLKSSLTFCSLLFLRWKFLRLLLLGFGWCCLGLSGSRLLRFWSRIGLVPPSPKSAHKNLRATLEMSLHEPYCHGWAFPSSTCLPVMAIPPCSCDPSSSLWVRFGSSPG